MTEQSSIAHVEDDPLWGDSVERLVSQMPGHVYVGRAATGRSAVQLCSQSRPTIILLDLILPDADGFFVFEKLRSVCPQAKTILLSCRADEYTMYRMSRGEFAGMIVKSVRFRADLQDALQSASSDAPFLCTEAKQAMRAFKASPLALHKIMSAHEIELLAAFAAGMSDVEIGLKHGLSHHTIHAHRTRVMSKLGVHGHAQPAQRAGELGFQTLRTKLTI